jgi:hypothetical protein
MGDSRDHYAPKLTEAHAAEIITSAVKSEAFALEGFPIKPLFAENILGKAAVKALRAAGVQFKEEASFNPESGGYRRSARFNAFGRFPQPI